MSNLWVLQQEGEVFADEAQELGVHLLHFKLQGNVD